MCATTTTTTTTASIRIRSEFPQSAYDAKNDDDDKKRRERGREGGEHDTVIQFLSLFIFNRSHSYSFLHAAICIRDQNSFSSSRYFPLL